MKILFVLSITILVVHKINSAAINKNSEFLFETSLNHYGTVYLKWRPLQDRVIFQIEAKTQGYVGFGITLNGGMVGSDILVCFFDKSNQPRIMDMHGVGEIQPKLDPSQDYVLHKAKRNGTHLIFNFSRKWKTCDDNDVNLSFQSNGIIWSTQDQAPSEDNGYFKFNYHGKNRGVRFLYLNSSNDFNTSQVEGAKVWNIQTSKANFKNGSDTLYLCSIVKFPEVKEKHHVIGYDAVIPDEYIVNAHHILLYECPAGEVTNQLKKYLNKEGITCYDGGFPLLWADCKTVALVWTVGNAGYNEPDHAGLPIEPNRDYLYLMEAHFDNIEFDTDIHPYAGVNVYYTNKLRNHDAGIIMVGATISDLMLIPSGLQEWKTVFHCDTNCFPWKSNEMNSINVYGLTPHTHLLGKKVLAQLIRNGSEVETLAKDYHYHFDFQRTLTYPEEKKIFPGDRIVTTCTYGSMGLARPTFGGIGTADEMCLMFLHYYPKMTLSMCLSVSTKTAYENNFNITFRRNMRYTRTFVETENGPVSFRKVFLPNLLQKGTTEKLKSILTNETQEMLCEELDKKGLNTKTIRPVKIEKFKSLPEKQEC